MKSRTKLVALHERNEEWISTTYTPLCKQVEKTFKKHCNKNITFITRNNLKRRLRTPKDNITEENKSGIYKINCNDCNNYYIGQTKRNLKKRFKEHDLHIRNENPEKSAIAPHCLNLNYSISINNMKLLK